MLSIAAGRNPHLRFGDPLFPSPFHAPLLAGYGRAIRVAWVSDVGYGWIQLISLFVFPRKAGHSRFLLSLGPSQINQCAFLRIRSSLH